MTPQLLRASKPMYALEATIPPPTCITGGATAIGEHVDNLRSLVPPPEDRPADDTNDSETPRSLMEPEFEHGNTPPRTRPRSSEELLNDGPIALRRRVEVPAQQLDLTPGELRADQGASITDHWRRSGTAERGIEFVEGQQDRERDEADALIALLINSRRQV